MLFCLFHAVFIIIGWEPNTFFEDLLHPLVRKLFLHLEKATFTSAMRNSKLDVPVGGSF